MCQQLFDNVFVIFWPADALMQMRDVLQCRSTLDVNNLQFSVQYSIT